MFSASRFLSQAPKSVKLKLKGGAYVDPDSELEDKAHVLKAGDNLYSAVLGAVNIQDGKNSYYKLQVLEHDKKKKFYLFRSWGRVGTTIGGTKLQAGDVLLPSCLQLFNLKLNKNILIKRVPL